ncbi:major royal jelly family protein [Pyxidicoccus xibeiensis]|uniref:major royal jelly family protein n=1 Tax=Pyxidicoccus xibeiensis TaxID=2906759 RepID=UPI0020A738A8|nr:major royal jelly family protein [Pyxidicoccus xibeiensis]MCP3144976.1 major royal jelly family protein [Pyxidicoccus xibeiensis]
MRKLSTCCAVLLLGLSGCRTSRNQETPGQSPGEATPAVKPATLEEVHAFHGPMPTGVTVSREGRIFVNYPRWGDPVRFTVAELRDGKEVPYPSAELHTDSPTGSPDKLLSVQSVVVDPRNRLWALDTGSLRLGPIAGQEWPKLVGFDLATNQVFKVIRFPAEVVRQNTYLNDVRFDLRRGQDGLAFITDSGAGGLIVVDLASGRSWRKLDGHESVKAAPDFVAPMEGQPLMIRRPGQEPQPFRVQSDGIALSADGSRLFYCPLSSRALYSVGVDALADEKLPDAEVLKTLQQEERRFASDGLESDAQGRVYLTDWEHNAIQVRDAAGQYSTLVTDPRLWWPDTLALSTDGYLYVTANQLHRQVQFHGGTDQRQKPYQLFRVKVEATPVPLAR